MTDLISFNKNKEDFIKSSQYYTLWLYLVYLYNGEYAICEQKKLTKKGI